VGWVAPVTRAFCTYFDHRYLPRAMVMLRSLERTGVDPHLYALCMDERAEEVLGRLAHERITIVTLRELEQADPELLAAKPTRNAIEYYFTCTPSLPLHLLTSHPELTQITYVDADLYFLASPEPLLVIADGADATIVPHRFAPDIELQRIRFGRYNVGWLSFQATPGGREVLAWWRHRCLEWCYDRPEDGRFADQGYLNDWPERFLGVVVLDHPGVNLAPWNVSRHSVEYRNGRLTADAETVFFYHVHALKPGLGGSFLTTLSEYGFRLTRALRRGVYRPYVRELRAANREVGRLDSVAESEAEIRLASPLAFRGRARTTVRALVRRDLLGPVVWPLTRR
jgi:hypothetical protein